MRINYPLFLLLSNISCKYRKIWGTRCTSSNTAPARYFFKNDSGFCSASCWTEGFSKFMYGLLLNNCLLRVVFPLCLGPVMHNALNCVSACFAPGNINRLIIWIPFLQKYVILELDSIFARNCKNGIDKTKGKLLKLARINLSEKGFFLFLSMPPLLKAGSKMQLLCWKRKQFE